MPVPCTMLLLAMNKTFSACDWVWHLHSPPNMWPSCGQGLACKLRFEVICSQLHVKCQTMTSFFLFYLSHLHFEKLLPSSATIETLNLCPYFFLCISMTLFHAVIRRWVIKHQGLCQPTRAMLPLSTSPVSCEKNQSAPLGVSDSSLAEGVTLG